MRDKITEFLDFMPWYKTKVATWLLGVVSVYNISIGNIDTESLLTIIRTAFDQPEIIAAATGVTYGLWVKVIRKSYFDTYVESVLWKAIEFDGKVEDPNNNHKYQCVDLVKHYSYYVHNISLWIFWWTAFSGFQNMNNTFPSYDFNKINNNLSDPSQVPNREDIIFFDNKFPFTYAGHVAIVLEANVGENLITVLEQNWIGKGTGKNGDEVRINTYNYKNVLWWYQIRK